MRLGLLLAVSLSVCSEASAEWQVKPFVGITFGGDTNLRYDFNFAIPKRKVAFGVSTTYLGQVLGFEADVGYKGGFFEGGKTISNSSLSTFTGNVIVALPRRMSEYTLRPYFVGGAGAVRPRTTTFAHVLELSKPIPAMDIGGGVTGFVSERVGVSWDVRRFQSFKGSTADPASTIDAVGQRISFWRANMALAIRY